MFGVLPRLVNEIVTYLAFISPAFSLLAYLLKNKTPAFIHKLIIIIGMILSFIYILNF